MAIKMTDHAVMRFVERVLGISDNELLAMMVPEHTRMAIREYGDGEYAISETHKVVVRKNVVITVAPRGEKL